MFNNARIIGVMTGIIVGLIVAVFVFRYVHRNKTLYTEYDEMQRQIRGEGYKYAFYTVLILEAVLCVLTMGMELPAEQHVIHFFVIFVGVTVQASYCIWKGAYIGQNTNLPRYIIIMAAASVINPAEAVGVSRQTISAIEKGDYNPTINLCIKICKVLGKTLDELFWTED